MQALEESKEFVRLHARHVGLVDAEIERVLGQITSLEEEGEGGWVSEWSRLAEERLRSGRSDQAAELYVLARFPVADTAAKEAAARCAADLTATRLAETGTGERRTAVVDRVEVPFLFSRPAGKPAPLVVMMGGIVALKEQWSGFLSLGRKIGCAVAIADFPGVGENRLPYTRAAARVYSAIMDAVAGDCDAGSTLAIAPSFGGHLALLCSAQDDRLRGLVTVGAPLRAFFTDPDVRAGTPEITRRALARTTGTPDDGPSGHLEALALTPEEIAALRIPVTYVAALRDEIIPAREWREAAALQPGLTVYAFDDVHGAPHHLRKTRLITLSALCRHAGRGMPAALLGLLARHVMRIRPSHDGRVALGGKP